MQRTRGVLVKSVFDPFKGNLFNLFFDIFETNPEQTIIIKPKLVSTLLISIISSILHCLV